MRADLSNFDFQPEIVAMRVSRPIISPLLAVKWGVSQPVYRSFNLSDMDDT